MSEWRFQTNLGLANCRAEVLGADVVSQRFVAEFAQALAPAEFSERAYWLDDDGRRRTREPDGTRHHRHVRSQSSKELTDPTYEARRQFANAARDMVKAALSAGMLKRPGGCEGCGRAAYTEAAHYDYSAPLKVYWLCQSCHRRWDRATPKTRDILVQGNVDPNDEPVAA